MQTPVSRHESPLPLWAKDRASLCEAVHHHFCAFQSGVYSRDKRAEGYLLDGFGASTDAAARDGRVLVSHTGGSADAAGVLVKHQTLDTGAGLALANAHEQGHPLLLVAGRRYNGFHGITAAFDAKPTARFVVLGFYRVTDLWHEPELGYDPAGQPKLWLRVKLRFEWVGAQGSPWWDDVEPLYRTSLPLDNHETPFIVCTACGRRVRRLHDPARICLEPTCGHFWKPVPPSDSPARHLLLPHPLADSALTLQLDLAPSPSSALLDRAPRLRVDFIDELPRRHEHWQRSSWAGFACRTCGLLGIVTEWASARCSECGYSVDVPIAKFTAAQLGCANLELRASQKPSSFITVSSSSGFIGRTHRLGNNCSVVHLSPSSPSTRLAVDRIFSDAQEPVYTSTLRRGKLDRGPVSGLHARHFSANFGARYHYGVDISTHPLDPPEHGADPAAVVRAAMTFASHAVSGAGCPTPTWNEALGIAYRSQMGISAHDDGERGLSGQVASLSLGGPAIIRFEPRRCPLGRSTARCTPPPAGIQQRDLPFSLCLRHGDILVMQGTDFQSRWLHGIDVKTMRFVFTFRNVGPQHRAGRIARAPAGDESESDGELSDEEGASRWR